MGRPRYQWTASTTHRAGTARHKGERGRPEAPQRCLELIRRDEDVWPWFCCWWTCLQRPGAASGVSRRAVVAPDVVLEAGPGTTSIGGPQPAAATPSPTAHWVSSSLFDPRSLTHRYHGPEIVSAEEVAKHNADTDCRVRRRHHEVSQGPPRLREVHHPLCGQACR